MKLYGTLYTIIYALLLIVIFVLPFFSYNEYSIIKNSISELGAQKTPNNWITNSIIILMSTITIVLGMHILKTYIIPLLGLLFFSFSFFLTGVFEMAGPFYEDHIYNYTFDGLHTLFSTLTGFGFCVFCLLLLPILKKNAHKVQSLLICILAMVLSYLIFKFPDYKGVFQRVLFISTFSWLFFALVSYPKKENETLAYEQESDCINHYSNYEKKL